MKKGLGIVLLLSLLLSGCATATATPALETDVATSASAAQTAVASPGPETMTAPAPASNSRKAILAEMEKSVYFRPAQDAQPTPASVGMEILPNGGIETGKDGRARLDLHPEKTIVRVGPNSSFTLPELSEADGKPVTTIELFFGKIYILLNGGSLNVKTPGGVASVHGSVMSVEYNPKTKGVKTACLEGHCTVKDEKGNEVELTDEEVSFIFEDEPPTDPVTIDSEEVEEWLEEIPEMPEFFEEVPAPEDFPEPDFDFEFEMPTGEPEATFEPGATEEPAIGDPDVPPDGDTPIEDPTDGGDVPPDDGSGNEPPPDDGGSDEPPPDDGGSKDPPPDDGGGGGDDGGGDSEPPADDGGGEVAPPEP
jgi:hypothetical protein